MDKDFDIKQLEQVRDVFAFCCLTGMAFADVQQLSKEHLVRDNEDNLWIRNACQKIKQMCNIPVISPAPKLIDKYSNQPECVAKNVLLPVLSNQKMNAKGNSRYLRNTETVDDSRCKTFKIYFLIEIQWIIKHIFYNR